MSTIKKQLPGTPRSYDVTPSHLAPRKVTRETANAPDEEAEQHTLSQYAVVPFARYAFCQGVGWVWGKLVHVQMENQIGIAILSQ